VVSSKSNKYENGLVPRECQACGTSELIRVKKSGFDRVLNMLMHFNVFRCERCHHKHRLFKSRLPFLFPAILVVLVIFFTSIVTPPPMNENQVIQDDKISRTVGEQDRQVVDAGPEKTVSAPVNKKSVLANLLEGATDDPGYLIDYAKTSDQGIDKVMTLDPGHYTIQISSGRTLEAVQELVHQLITTRSMPEPFFFYRSDIQPDTWYPILYGDFQDIQGARAAMATLPKPIRLKKPFIRKVASIHKKISG